MRKNYIYLKSVRFPIPYRPGRPQTTKKGKKGYSRPTAKKVIRYTILEHSNN